jgi:predicted MFS family arabinose efflux permease
LSVVPGRLLIVSLAPYRELLARPLVLALVLAGVLCRIPNSAATVAITVFVVSGRGGSYAQAGLVAAVMTVGAAVGSPWRGKALDRVGLRRAAAPSVLVEGAVWFAFPFLSYRFMLVAAFAGGLLAVPVYSVLRQAMSVLAAPSQQRTAFSLDSISTELSYLVGPAGAALAAAWSPRGAVFLVGAATVVAGVGLMVFNPPIRAAERAEGVELVEGVKRVEGAMPSTSVTGSTEGAERGAGEESPGTAGSVGGAGPAGGVGAEPARQVAGGARPSGATGSGGSGGPTGPSGPTAAAEPGRFQGLRELATPRLLATLAATATALAIIGGTDVSIVALTREAGQTDLTWIVFVAWSLASMIGALVFGGSRRPVPVFAIVLGLALLTAPAGLAPNAWWLALIIIPAGVLGAPAIAAAATEVTRLVPEHRRGEAMGWYGSALTIGLASGTPLAGRAIDAAGPRAGFALTGAIGAVVAVVGLVLIAWATDRPSSVVRPALIGESPPEPGAPSGVSPTRRQRPQATEV